MPLHRITITIPESLVREVDRLARQLDRSRSWVVSDAVRRHVAAAAQAASGERSVREPESRPYGVVSGLGPSRQTQLEADLALTLEERVKAAEQTARVPDLVRPAPSRRDRILFFDSYEDYLDWKRREDLRP
jgi:hypothetical protein